MGIYGQILINVYMKDDMTEDDAYDYYDELFQKIEQVVNDNNEQQKVINSKVIDPEEAIEIPNDISS